jgi:plasmid stability protein
MASIYIRDLSPATYERLKERAKQNRRSITQEAAVVLDAALNKQEQSKELWERIDRIRERVTARYGSFSDSTAKVREDRKR